MSDTSRYSMRRSTRQGSSTAPPAPRGNNLREGGSETRAGLGARGSPATSRSTAYGGRNVEMPRGVSTQATRAPPSSLLGAAVAGSRELTDQAPAIKTVRKAADESSESGGSAAHTDETPLGDDDDDDGESDSDDGGISEDDNSSSAPLGDEPVSETQQQEQRSERAKSQSHHSKSAPTRVGSRISSATSSAFNAVAWMSRKLASAWKYICVLLFSAFFLSAVQQTFIPSLSPSIPVIDLACFTDLLGLVSSNPSSVIFNSTASGAGAIYHGVSSWQFDRLASRVNHLEVSIGSLSSKLKTKPPLRRVNFFAPVSGVLVDPYLTSPTRPLTFGHGAKIAAPRSLIDKITGRQSSLLPRLGPGPSTVFQPWDDAGECWCSPQSGGKSQIAMALPRAVVPQDLVVEHIPRTATLDSGSMPRDLEFWVQIMDRATRERVANMALDVVNLSLLEDSDEDSDTGRPSLALDSYGARKALDETWVRVGRFQFDKDAGETAQIFHIPVDLGAFDAPVSRMVVRTTSSWGKSGSVCLYRLKLYGLAVEEMPGRTV